MRRKIKREKQKNYFPTFIITLLLWGSLLLYILTIAPSNAIYILGMLILSFLSLLFTFSILLKSTRKGFLLAIGVIIFLILRTIKVGNILNLGLIIGILITIEIYLSKR